MKASQPSPVDFRFWRSLALCHPQTQTPNRLPRLFSDAVLYTGRTSKEKSAEKLASGLSAFPEQRQAADNIVQGRPCARMAAVQSLLACKYRVRYGWFSQACAANRLNVSPQVHVKNLRPKRVV